MSDDNDIIARAAKKAGKDGNDKFFTKLKELSDQEAEERNLLQDIWQRLGDKPDFETDPQYQKLTKLLERKGWL